MCGGFVVLQICVEGAGRRKGSQARGTVIPRVPAPRTLLSLSVAGPRTPRASAPPWLVTPHPLPTPQPPWAAGSVLGLRSQPQAGLPVRRAPAPTSQRPSPTFTAPGFSPASSPTWPATRDFASCVLTENRMETRQGQGHPPRPPASGTGSPALPPLWFRGTKPPSCRCSASSL